MIGYGVTGIVLGLNEIWIVLRILPEDEERGFGVIISENFCVTIHRVLLCNIVLVHREMDFCLPQIRHYTALVIASPR